MRDGMPVSTAFDDVYFSREGGVAETEHVFLRGNGLPARWQAACSNGDDDARVGSVEPLGERRARGQGPRQHSYFCPAEPRSFSAEGTKGTKRSLQGFTLCELGFGTGLNFLVTMKEFRATAPVNAKLHYIAIEKFPFAPESLRALLAQQPELAHEAEILLAAYPLRLPGIHRIHLGNVTLTLCFGDVVEMLEAIHTPINAWYLDGFSPAKNGQMWGEAIYQQMRRLSAPGSTFATFTAASHVRRGLEAVGFTVTKTRGFAHKREMSVGVLRVESPASSEEAVASYPSPVTSEEGVASGQSPVVSEDEAGSAVIIIGAGIAGATLARALAERGYRVTVLERQHVASGASGNRAGVLFPHITKRWGTSSAWYFTAYGYALRELQRWQAQGLAFTQTSCGMLRLPRNAEEEIVLTHVQETHGLDAGIVHWLPREAASAHAGVPLETGAAFFPAGTWLNPEQLCAALLQHAHITVREHSAVQSLNRRGDHWRITLASGEAIEAVICCITAAHESAVLLNDYGITLGSVGGQVSEFSGDNAAVNLRSILCHSGYAIPTHKTLTVGATYHRDDMLEVTAARHDENRAALSAIVPSMPALEIVSGRSSIRATTPDRMPYIGAIDAGLYVATGFGSRGLLSAPLAAEIIASEVAGETPPVTQALLHTVRPMRFKKAPATPHPQSLHA